jgi:hypothetical protein
MYPDYPYFAVAITRTCGSGGGSYIGKQLAKAFDIDLYDRKLLRLASEDSGISEELFARADENTRKTMLYRVSERVYAASSRRKAATLSAMKTCSTTRPRCCGSC